MKSGHKCICISVGCVSFFGCLSLEPVGTLLLLIGAALLIYIAMQGDSDGE